MKHSWPVSACVKWKSRLPDFLVTYGSTFFINFLVHEPLVKDSHSACHRTKVSFLVFLLDSVLRYLPLYLTVRYWASKCAGIIEATTSIASINIVRYAIATINTIVHCGLSNTLTFVVNVKDPAQTGAAYRSWLWITDANNRLFFSPDPLTFDKILHRVNAIFDTLADAARRWALNPSFLLILHLDTSIPLTVQSHCSYTRSLACHNLSSWLVRLYICTVIHMI